LGIPVFLVSGFMAFGAAGPSEALAQSETANPQKVKQHVVAVVPRHWPPQYSVDENGHPSGFAIDVMEAVAARAGLSVAYRVVDSFAKAISALKSGDADLIPNVGIIERRKKFFAFTAPVETFNVSIFVRDDTHDLTGEAGLVGRKLGVVESNVGKFMFQKRQDIDVNVYPDVRTALFELFAGHVDALVYPQSVLLALAREAGVEDHLKVVGKPLREIKRGISVRKDDVALLAVLEKAVESYVGSPAFQKVYAKWYGKPVLFWTTPRVIWSIAGFVVITILLTGGWHYLAAVRLNRALRESEERFRTLVEATTSIVWTTDPDGGFSEPQDSWRDYTGQSWPDHQGYGWAEMIHPDDIGEVKRTWAQSLETQTNYLAEGRLWSAVENAYRHFLVRAVPLLNKDGSVQKWIGTVADIHERKMAEKATQESEARLAGILDIAPEAVIAIGKNMNIRLFNKGAERIFGYTSEEVLGKPLEILMPERSRRVHAKHVKAFENSHETYRLMNERTEITGLRKNGTEFPASASVSKLDLVDQKIFTVLLYDITQNKQAEEAIISSKTEAEFANYAKTQFLAHMSHELRTPLNSIIGFSQILMGQGLGELNFLDSSVYAGHINDSANHLLAVIQDILDVSKIEAGELDLEKESLDFKNIIQECIIMVKERAEKDGVILSYKVAESVSSIEADKVRIKQILLNLLSNAIKFTPSGGRVEIVVEPSGDKSVLLSIDDTGIGIEKNDIKKILQPFGQVKDIMKRNHEGTGLGLSLANSLVELHGGKLAISSEVGRGTTVVVQLPTGLGEASLPASFLTN